MKTVTSSSEASSSDVVGALLELSGTFVRIDLDLGNKCTKTGVILHITASVR